MSLKDAMALGGVSVEDFQQLPPADVPVVSPTNDPSSTIPLPTPVPSAEPGVPVEVVETAPLNPVEIVEADPVIQATDNIVAEHQAIQDRADEIIALQQSMEQYKGLIQKAGAKGISNETAQFIQVAMRSAQKQLGVETKIGSMESFAAKGPREQHELATVALEDIRTTAKAAAGKFLRLVEQFISYIRKYGMQFMDGITNLETQLTTLEKSLQSNKQTGGGRQIEVQNLQYFSHNGQVDLEPSAEVKGLAHFAAVGYPEAVVKYLDGLTKAVLKYDAESGNDEELTAHFEAAAKPLSFLIEQKLTDDELPGGFKLDVSESGLSVGITKGEGGESEVGTIDVAPTVELRKAVRSLKELVLQMKEIRQETEKVGKAGDKLIAAVKRKNADSVSDKAAQLVAQSSPRIGEIISYLVRYVKIEMTIIHKMNAVNSEPAE